MEIQKTLNQAKDEKELINDLVESDLKQFNQMVDTARKVKELNTVPPKARPKRIREKEKKKWYLREMQTLYDAQNRDVYRIHTWNTFVTGLYCAYKTPWIWDYRTIK